MIQPSPPARRVVVTLAAAIALVLIGSVVAIVVQSRNARASDPAAAAVRRDFEQFRSALLSRDGAAAAGLVSAATISTYEGYRVSALTANKTDLQRHSLIQQFIVLRLRHQIDATTLGKMEGKTLLAYGIDKGWISESTVVATRIDRVSVLGPVAAIDATIRGRTQVTFELQREEGRWKIDLIGLLAAGERGFNILAEQRGRSEEEFLFEMLEAVSGRRVDESIWIPPR